MGMPIRFTRLPSDCSSQVHPLVTVIVDEAAGAKLAHRDYYRFAWDNRLSFER